MLTTSATPSGCSARTPASPPWPRHARAGHRGQHGHLQRRQRCAAPAAALPQPDRIMASAERPGRRRREEHRVDAELPRLARRERGVRGDGHLPDRRRDDRGPSAPVRLRTATYPTASSTLCASARPRPRVRPDDHRPGAAPALVLSRAAWRQLRQRPLDRRPEVRLDGESATVVGVMPAGFTFPRRVDAWRALVFDRARCRDAGWPSCRWSAG